MARRSDSRPKARYVFLTGLQPDWLISPLTLAPLAHIRTDPPLEHTGADTPFARTFRQAIYDAMSFVRNEIHTVGVGVAIGQACMLLSAGEKGKRYMLEHATAMLHQPRCPPTGARQAIEVDIKWKEVLAQKNNMLEIMSRTTGHDTKKLEEDMARPLYMQPKDAIRYGIVDGIITPTENIVGAVKSAEQWDKDAGLVRA